MTDEERNLARKLAIVLQETAIELCRVTGMRELPAPIEAVLVEALGLGWYPVSTGGVGRSMNN